MLASYYGKQNGEIRDYSLHRNRIKDIIRKLVAYYFRIEKYSLKHLSLTLREGINLDLMSEEEFLVFMANKLLFWIMREK